MASTSRQAWTARLGRTARLLAAAAALPALGCATDDVLGVTDPDIINPGDLRDAGGADALRIGAISRFVGATTGYNGGSLGETIFVYSGLLTDEWQTGDTFIQRVETDQRRGTIENSAVDNSFLYLQRARLTGEQAVAALREFAPTAPGWQVAEMYFVQGYVENMLGEAFCSGVPFSTVVDGVEQFGAATTTAETYARALAHADSALALIPATATAANDVRVRNAARVLKARILVNTAKFAEAAAVVPATAVPTTFAYQNQHSQTSQDNGVWFVNNNTRRYSVGNREGTNGLNFATANDPRLPVCAGGSAACRTAGVTQRLVFNTLSPTPLFVQLVWPVREAPVTVAGGVEARLYEAEAQLKGGNAAGARDILNALRSTVPGLAPLVLQATEAAQVDQLFRERAFWLWGRGHRLGDLRRLIRQYGRTQAQVFPVGEFAEGGSYGTDVNFPIPQTEQNNPEFDTPDQCIDRNA